MDTRSKIIADVNLARGAAAVTGYFDVLRPWHIQELARIKAAHQKLAAVVLPLENAMLSQRARAELVAALRVIDYVIIAEDGEPQAILSKLAPVAAVRLEETDLRRRGELIEHVHRRQTR